MTIDAALRNIRVFSHPPQSPVVVETAVAEIRNRIQLFTASIEERPEEPNRKGVFEVSVKPSSKTMEKEGVFFRIRNDGSGSIFASRPHFLFSFVMYLLDVLSKKDSSEFEKGKHFAPSFPWQRVSYDYFLTQEGRIQAGLDRKSLVRKLASLGFTHVEVNALAYPMGLETGPKGEIYPMFYTYCPALDQFTSSSLNQGLYPKYYLSANMANLKTIARLAVSYGLTPGLLCFEPRSVPEEFFFRYPMLRGARVDHPFRSFKPRYTMTLTHPKVREHYAEMLRNIMAEVPELGFLSVWTNDSGSGFEHTRSLYVGRNGGPYLIREWKDDVEIARCAGENALRFFRTMRDAGREVNSEFRVITRLESFFGEHDTVWKGFEDGIDVETNSLASRGWESGYTHPKYPEIKTMTGTIYQGPWNPAERRLLGDLRNRKAEAHFYFGAGPHTLFEPLLGIPYPTLVHKSLVSFRKLGVTHLAHSGGTCPPELVPFDVNHEIVRLFQFCPDMDILAEIRKIAGLWAGEADKEDLVRAWQWAEEAVLGYPPIVPLYTTIGFTWYRLWARPLVPDIEAIPAEERSYYESFMCTTPHNPNNVDLCRDVLFQLTTPGEAALGASLIDAHCRVPLQKAAGLLESLEKKPEAALVIRDQRVRLQALGCWLETMRNVLAWISGVHGYMNSSTAKEKKKLRDLVTELMHREIANTVALEKLLDSGVPFMAMTDLGETPLVHGTNLKSLLPKRRDLMERHMADEPHIDPLYMERKAGECMCD